MILDIAENLVPYIIFGFVLLSLVNKFFWDYKEQVKRNRKNAKRRAAYADKRNGTINGYNWNNVKVRY